MTRRTHTQRQLFTLLGAIAALASAAGCYERVVRADGPNASQYEVYEPSNSNNVIDQAIDGLFGTEPEKKKRGGRR